MKLRELRNTRNTQTIRSFHQKAFAWFADLAVENNPWAIWGWMQCLARLIGLGYST